MVARILSDQLGEDIGVAEIWPGSSPAEERGGQGDQDEQSVESLWSDQHTGRSLHGLVEYADDGPGRGAQLSGPVLVSIGVDWLTSETGNRPFRPKTGGEEITPETIGVLAHRVKQLRRLDDAQSGSLVAEWSMHDLQWALQLAEDGSYDAATGIQLYRAIAELAQLAGWVLVDQGRRASGMRHLLAGLRAATVAGDRSLGAYILSCLSYHLMWSGNGRDALRLIKIARTAEDDTMAGAVRALLATRQARAHARLGEESACQWALAEAAESFDATESIAAPSWSYWVTPAVLEADAGRARLDLGHPDRAEKHLVEGLRQLDGQQRRNRLLHCISVAQARLALGELDGAVEVTRQALDLTKDVWSGRARSRLKGLRSSLVVHRAPAAREAADDIEQILTVPRNSGQAGNFRC